MNLEPWCISTTRDHVDACCTESRSKPIRIQTRFLTSYLALAGQLMANPHTQLTGLHSDVIRVLLTLLRLRKRPCKSNCVRVKSIRPRKELIGHVKCIMFSWKQIICSCHRNFCGTTWLLFDCTSSTFGTMSTETELNSPCRSKWQIRHSLREQKYGSEIEWKKLSFQSDSFICRV